MLIRHEAVVYEGGAGAQQEDENGEEGGGLEEQASEHRVAGRGSGGGLSRCRRGRRFRGPADSDGRGGDLAVALGLFQGVADETHRKAETSRDYSAGVREPIAWSGRLKAERRSVGGSEAGASPDVNISRGSFWSKKADVSERRLCLNTAN